MDIVEPEPQYRMRRKKLFINTSFWTLFSAMAILFMAWLMELWYRARGQDDALELELMCFSGVLLVVAIAYFILRPSGIRLMECVRLKPMRLAWTSLTLNARYSVDVSQIGNIYRDYLWKELRFTLAKPRAVVIINDTEFVREVLRKHRDKWPTWAYSEDKLPFW